MFTPKQISDIVSLYEKGKYSIGVIAQQYNTYPNKIRRLLIKQGTTLRDKSTAQKVALKAGRSEHPTEGKPRPDGVKVKISESVFSHWKDLSDQEYQKRVEKSREQWYNMSETEREALHKAATAAVREASKSGSKIEHFLNEELTKAGYSVLFHKKGLIANSDLEVDLFLPSINTAIEVDGPTHFLPIWGEEKLQKHIKSDADKAGLLLSSGFCIIRIKHLAKNVSAKYKRDLLKIILEKIKEIDQKFPDKGKRFIEVEV